MCSFSFNNALSTTFFHYLLSQPCSFPLSTKIFQFHFALCSPSPATSTKPYLHQTLLLFLSKGFSDSPEQSVSESEEEQGSDFKEQSISNFEEEELDFKADEDEEEQIVDSPHLHKDQKSQNVDFLLRSSRFARIQNIRCAIAGRNMYVRFSCSTGDAMGMNMVSKGVQNVLDFLQNDFPDMDVVGISGNYCSDKKLAAVNWIEGLGKSLVCEAIITEEVVKKVLKTSVGALVELNMLKNLAGSAVASALGGFNAHAANIVSAMFIATGQDPAQNIESSHCITMMEAANDGKDLHVSITMPSIEIKAFEAVICVAASQIANLGESIIGAALQEKEGFRWLNNDAVNVINITMGNIVVVLLQQIVLQNWVA